MYIYTHLYIYVSSEKYTRCTVFQNYYYLHIKLLFWKEKSAIGSYTSQTVLLSCGRPCFFQRSNFFMKPFV